MLKHISLMFELACPGFYRVIVVMKKCEEAGCIERSEENRG